MPQFVITQAFTLLVASLCAAIPSELLKELMSRDDVQPPRALPQNASPEELRWQPAMDFDKDSCYNVPAIDASGNVVKGLGLGAGTEFADRCRDEADLDNNNVYVRTRCNNNWCAHVYAYYFEKDVDSPSRPGPKGYDLPATGHIHDWEHVIVFTERGEFRIVAASEHKDYNTHMKREEVEWEKDTDHVKIVYHTHGSFTHAFRFAKKDESSAENHKGKWFRGPLVGYDGFPSTSVRDTLMGHDFGAATLAIKNSKIKENIDKARDGGAPGFDSGLDA